LFGQEWYLFLLDYPLGNLRVFDGKSPLKEQVLSLKYMDFFGHVHSFSMATFYNVARGYENQRLLKTYEISISP